MQCDGQDDESRFTKSRGHEQFIASLCAAKFADQVLDPDPEYSNHPMLFHKSSIFEEPIKSTLNLNP